MNDHFNTTSETGEVLVNYKANARTQQKTILKLFAVHEKLSPSQAWMAIGMPDWPLTSIRRAISNLTRAGYLKKLPEKVIGYYKHPEHVWTFDFNDY